MSSQSALARSFTRCDVMRRMGGRRRTSYRRAVHDLELGDRLALVILVGWGARCLAADDGELHVLDLDAHEEEVDLADYHVFKVVSASACQ